MTSNASVYEPALSGSPRETERGRRRHLVIADDCAEMRQFVRDAVGPQFDDVIEVADGRALFWALLRSSFAAANATAREGCNRRAWLRTKYGGPEHAQPQVDDVCLRHA